MYTQLVLLGNELTDQYYHQLNEASQREFRVRLPAKAELSNRRYFLLVETETGNILASGYLKLISPVICNQKTFSFLNIGDVIANDKGKGYGKQVMAAIRAYLLAQDVIGLGFCAPHNQEFYEKCGFRVETGATHRFIYRNGEERQTAGGQYILYQDSRDRFLEQVLAQREHEVFVPEPTVW